MRKKDDCTLGQGDYLKVRKEAERLLFEAGAVGCFPTPISDILRAADVELVDDNVLDESFISKIIKKTGNTLKPLKRALSKVLGVLHVSAKLVFIDKTVHAVRQSFLKIHETGHFFLPWQKDIYAVVEDCEKTIAPEMDDHFDREANVFTSEVLFQLDSFTDGANEEPFGILVPVKLSKKYGASIYASIRRYVSKSPKSCVVLVLNPPELIAGDGFQASLRRVVASEKFTEKFGQITWPNFFSPNDEIGAMVPTGQRKMSGCREIGIKDSNGNTHDCVAEAFTQTYQVFILIHDVRTLTAKNIIF